MPTIVVDRGYLGLFTAKMRGGGGGGGDDDDESDDDENNDDDPFANDDGKKLFAAVFWKRFSQQFSGKNHL